MNFKIFFLLLFIFSCGRQVSIPEATPQNKTQTNNIVGECQARKVVGMCLVNSP